MAILLCLLLVLRRLKETIGGVVVCSTTFPLPPPSLYLGFAGVGGLNRCTLPPSLPDSALRSALNLRRLPAAALPLPYYTTIPRRPLLHGLCRN